MTWWMAAGLAPLALLEMVTRLDSPLVAKASQIVGVAGSIALFASLAILNIRFYGGAMATSVAKAWLRVGRCPWCTYRLRELGVNDDVTVTCPECGGIWKLGYGDEEVVR
jgi:hypothetical protein